MKSVPFLTPATHSSAANSPSPSPVPSPPNSILLLSAIPLHRQIIPLPPPLPPLLTLLPLPSSLVADPAAEADSTDGKRLGNAASTLSDICFEFLQVDDRPTAILEVLQKVASSATADEVDVTILFTNPAFEHLKPQLKLDFKSSSSMGGIIKQDDSSVEWAVPNSDWQLRCVSISGADGSDKSSAVGKRDRWLKVLTIGPVLSQKSLRDELEVGMVPSDHGTEQHFDTIDTLQNVATPEILENYGGGGEGDVRRYSIVEETAHDIAAQLDVTTTEPRTEDGTPSSSKTITPSYINAANTARGGSLASSNSTSRRSSRSLPGSRKSSHPGISGPLTTRSESESGTEETLVDRSSIDWTRGRKNSRNSTGIDDEHLKFLMKAPW